MYDKVGEDLKTKDQFELFERGDGKTGLQVYLTVSDFTASNSEGHSVTITSATGQAEFIRNSTGNWVLDAVNVAEVNGTSVVSHRFKPNIIVN